MSRPWLNIVGIGEDGLDGLSQAARAAVTGADVLIGGARHHELAGSVTAERVTWPRPFDSMVETIEGWRGRNVCVLVTGDPGWYSAGEKIASRFKPEEVCIHPHVSAFQMAASRMGWPLQDVSTLTVHGRPVETILPDLFPGARLMLLAHNEDTPLHVAGLLAQNGFGRSPMTALSFMGGPRETRIDGRADTWQDKPAGFHTLCIECTADAGTTVLQRGPGLPDAAFEHDGKMTKSEIRAITLSRLAPSPGELLWDIGCGCGSVAIEWMRMNRNARAIGLEPHADRRGMATRNAHNLGVPGLQLIDAAAPAGLAGLDAPDAVFVGGGLNEATVDACLLALKPHGRLVANAVTLESEQILSRLQERHGGHLVRIAVTRAEPVGRYHGWKPFMPVTQWSKAL